MTINSCNAYEHFSRYGDFSLNGKSCFWNEVDELLERFDRIKIKLLPNPKNQPKLKSSVTAVDSYRTMTGIPSLPSARGNTHNSYRGDDFDMRRPRIPCLLPVPPQADHFGHLRHF